MSHGKIFQIGLEPIPAEKHVKPDHFVEHCEDYADYIGDAREGDERQECIDYLAGVIRELFIHMGGSLFVYKGPKALKAFKRKWAAAIHKQARAVTVENLTKYNPRAMVRTVMYGTHHKNEDRYVMHFWTGEAAEPLSDFVEMCEELLQEGQPIYIGAVIHFHY